jgi:hypothetical protein
MSTTAAAEDAATGGRPVTAVVGGWAPVVGPVVGPVVVIVEPALASAPDVEVSTAVVKAAGSSPPHRSVATTTPVVPRRRVRAMTR